MILGVAGAKWVRLPPILEALAFWSAIFLPVVYLPMLAMGLETIIQQTLFLSLISLNVLTIVIGHRHQLE